MKIDDKFRDEILQCDINGEAAEISVLSSGKIDKYEEILPSNQRQVIKQAKLTYSPLGKVFEIQTKTIEERGIKQKDVITNQNERLATNKDDHKDGHKDIYKEIFDKIVKEKFDEIKDLTYEINHDYLTYFFKNDTAKK